MGSRAAPNVDLLAALVDVIATANSDQLRDAVAALQAERAQLDRATAAFEVAKIEHEARVARVYARERSVTNREAAADQRDQALSSSADRLARQRIEQEAAGEKLKALRRDLDRRAPELAEQQSAFARTNLRVVAE